MKVASFVSGPLVKNPNTINLGLFHISDWFSTILGLAGVSTEGLNLDGYDQWSSISGISDSPRKVSQFLCWEKSRNYTFYRKGNSESLFSYVCNCKIYSELFTLTGNKILVVLAVCLLRRSF